MPSYLGLNLVLAVVVPFAAALVLVFLIHPSRITTVVGRLNCSDRLFWILFGAGIVLSAALFTFVRFNLPLSRLTDYYFLRAENIAARGVFGYGDTPIAFAAPGYSFLLVPAALLMGDTEWVFCLTNILLFASCTLLIRRLLLRTGVPRGTANLIALLALLYPNRWLAAWSQLSDIPYSFVFGLAFACALMVFSSAHQQRFSFTMGLLAGASALIRSGGLLLSLPLLGGIALTKHSVRDRIRWLGVAIAGMAIVLAPWIVRNYLLLGKIVPVSTNAGFNLLIGNNPTGDVFWNKYAEHLLAREGDKSWSETRKDSFYTAHALEYIQQHPGPVIVAAVKKVLRAFASDTFTMTLGAYETNLHELPPIVWNIVYPLNNLIYFTLLLFTLIAVVRQWRLIQPAGWMYAGIWICVCLLIGMMFGMTRFKEPLNVVNLLILGYCVSRQHMSQGKHT